MISVLHTWGPILIVAGGALSVLLAVPAFRFGGVWRTCLRIAAFVLILGLSMVLEEQILLSRRLLGLWENVGGWAGVELARLRSLELFQPRQGLEVVPCLTTNSSATIAKHCSPRSSLSSTTKKARFYAHTVAAKR